MNHKSGIANGSTRSEVTNNYSFISTTQFLYNFLLCIDLSTFPSRHPIASKLAQIQTQEDVQKH